MSPPGSRRTAPGGPAAHEAIGERLPGAPPPIGERRGTAPRSRGNLSPIAPIAPIAPAWLDETEAHAWVGLITLSSRIVTLSDGELRRNHGLSGRDYELLHHLSETRGGQKVSDLAAVIDDTSSCITHRVNRLCAAGLVTKTGDASDHRVRRIRLTAQGRALLRAAAPEHVARVRAWVIDALAPQDVDHLGRITNQLVAHLRATT